MSTTLSPTGVTRATDDIGSPITVNHSGAPSFSEQLQMMIDAEQKKANGLWMNGMVSLYNSFRYMISSCPRINVPILPIYIQYTGFGCSPVYPYIQVMTAILLEGLC